MIDEDRSSTQLGLEGAFLRLLVSNFQIDPIFLKHIQAEIIVLVKQERRIEKKSMIPFLFYNIALKHTEFIIGGKV